MLTRGEECCEVKEGEGLFPSHSPFDELLCSLKRITIFIMWWCVSLTGRTFWWYGWLDLTPLLVWDGEQDPKRTHKKFLLVRQEGKKTPDSLNRFRDYQEDVRCLMEEGSYPNISAYICIYACNWLPLQTKIWIWEKRIETYWWSCSSNIRTWASLIR